MKLINLIYPLSVVALMSLTCDKKETKELPKAEYKKQTIEYDSMSKYDSTYINKMVDKITEHRGD